VVPVAKDVSIVENTKEKSSKMNRINTRRRVAVYTKQVPRYHRDTKNIPSNVRGQVQRNDKACIRKNCESDINHPNQIFLTKPNTSHGYNLRSKPGSVAIPKSGTQRHANSFKARAATFL